MKGFKKLLTGILAGAMAFTMAFSTGSAAQVQAEENKTAGSGTITIEEAIAGQTYDAYRLFDFIPTEADPQKGVYKLSSKFAGFASYTEVEGESTVFKASDYFTIDVNNDNILKFSEVLLERDNNNQATDASKTAASKLGQAALRYAKAQNPPIAYDATTTAAITDNIKAGAKTTATINVVGYGYYVVDSSLGTAVSIDTSTPNATIKEKNSVPELDKKITGATNSTTITTDKTGNNAQIGDTVNFKITAEFKAGGENYKIVDTVTKGLSLDLNTITVAFTNDVTMEYKKTSITEDVKVGEETETRNGFKLEFAGVPSKDTTVTVTYSATVNKDAEINTSTNINEAYIIYGHDTETTHKTTTTKTYPLQVKKIALGTEDVQNPAILGGAEFEVYREFNNTKLYFLKKSENEEVYTVVPNGTQGAVTTITTVKDKPFTINGLNTEDYILVETKAPVGYNLLESTVTAGEGDDRIEYKHAQKVTVTESSNTTAPQVELVKDGTGLTLPSTGGIGTTIFYIVGGLLIVAGAAYFIVRRKANAE